MVTSLTARTNTIALLVVVLLCVIAVMAILTDSRTLDPSTNHPGTRTEGGGQPATPNAERRLAVVSTVRYSEGSSILVVDARYSPVAGARVFALPTECSDRELVVGQDSFLGLTGPDGRYEFPIEGNSGRYGAILISKKGYVSAETPWPEAESEVVLTLVEGTTLRLRFQTEKGDPVTDVRVVASGSILPTSESGEDSDPGERIPRPGRWGIVRGCSDKAGAVVFEGMEPGEVNVSYHHHTLVPADGRSALMIVLPTDEVVLTLADVWVGAIDVEGDEILSARAKINGRFHAVYPNISIERAYNRLMEDASPVTRFVVVGGRPEDGLGIMVHCVFVSTGTEAVFLPLAPLSAYDGPIKVRRHGVARSATCGVSVRFVQPNGDDASGYPHFALDLRGGALTGWDTVRYGSRSPSPAEFLVPMGIGLTVRPYPDAAAGDFDAFSISEVSSDAEIVVRLKRHVVQCEVRTQTNGGQGIDIYEVVVSASGYRRHVRLVEGRGRIWLPADVSATFSARGHGVTVEPLHIVPRPGVKASIVLVAR